MIINHPNLMCVGVKEPNEWEFDGNRGITYKVQLSDGTEAIEMKCDNSQVWGVFKAFKNYQVSFRVSQTTSNGRQGVRCIVVGANPVKA